MNNIKMFGRRWLKNWLKNGLKKLEKQVEKLSKNFNYF